MIRLYRTSSFYRPLSILVKNKSYEINNIIFFNEKGIITQIGSGFFDDDKERDFFGTCVRKLKVDYNMKDNFIVVTKKEYHWEEIKCDLYIYEKNINIAFLGTEQKYFGNIYSHWKVNDYDFYEYKKSINRNLSALNNEAEEIIKELGSLYGYNKMGVDTEELKIKLNNLKKVNKKIFQEVENIKNYQE